MLFRTPTPHFSVNAPAIIERGTRQGTEVLLQRREKPGEPRRLEVPGGQLEPLESLLTAPRREVYEETGLTTTALLDPPHERVSGSPGGEAGCLTPSFVYQTRRGPVDSVGFFFRARAGGDLTRAGGQAEGRVWAPLAELRRLDAEPETFAWLTQGALGFSLIRVGA